MTIALHAPATDPIATDRTARRAEAPARIGTRPTTKRSPVFVLVPLVTLIVFATLLTAAFVQSMLVTGQKQLDGIERETTEELQQLQHERLRYAAETSPETVARRAAELGMVPAEQRIVIAPGTDPDPQPETVAP